MMYTMCVCVCIYIYYIYSYDYKLIHCQYSHLLLILTVNKVVIVVVRSQLKVVSAPYTTTSDEFGFHSGIWL